MWKKITWFQQQHIQCWWGNPPAQIYCVLPQENAGGVAPARRAQWLLIGAIAAVNNRMLETWHAGCTHVDRWVDLGTISLPLDGSHLGQSPLKQLRFKQSMASFRVTIVTPPLHLWKSNAVTHGEQHCHREGVAGWTSTFRWTLHKSLTF